MIRQGPVLAAPLGQPRLATRHSPPAEEARGVAAGGAHSVPYNSKHPAGTCGSGDCVSSSGMGFVVRGMEGAIATEFEFPAGTVGYQLGQFALGNFQIPSVTARCVACTTPECARPRARQVSEARTQSHFPGLVGNGALLRPRTLHSGFVAYPATSSVGQIIFVIFSSVTGSKTAI